MRKAIFSCCFLVACVLTPAAKSQTQFTLGIVLSNPAIDSEKVMELVQEVQNSPKIQIETFSYYYNNSSLAATRLANMDFRLQLNPVHTLGLGLDKIIRQLFCSPESRGTTAIFFLVDQSASSHNGALLSNFMATLGSFYGIPAIAWSTSIIELEQSKNELAMLLLAPSVRSQARAIYSLFRRYLPERKASILISEQSKGHEQFVDEMRLLSEEDERGRRYSRFQFDSHQSHMSKRLVEVVPVDNSIPDTIRKGLVFLRDNTDSRIFVLYADAATADKIMEEAHVLGMSTSEYSWVLAKPAFNETVPQNYLPGTIVVTYNTSFNFQMLALKAAIRVWSEAIRRLVMYTRPGDSLTPAVSCTRFTAPKWNLRMIFHGLMKQRLAKIMAAQGDSAVFSGLNDLTLLSLQMNRQWQRLGEWKPSTGLNIDNEKWLMRYEKQIRLSLSSFRSTVVRIATLDESPYVIYELPSTTGTCPKNSAPCRLAPIGSDEAHAHFFAGGGQLSEHQRGNGTLVCCMGFVIDLLRKLSADIGFQFELFEVADRKWGAYDATTKQWNGLVKALLDGSADMVATSLKMNKERNSAVDFSVPFYETGVTILVRVREGLVSNVAFLQPFSVDTWLIIFFGCVNACALFIFGFENFAKICWFHDEEQATDEAQATNSSTSLIGSFWLVLSMLFNAAMKTSIPRSISGRLVANVWAFVCVIIMSSFMANLAAFMITKEEFHDFTGLDDFRLTNPFSKNPPWKFSTIPSGATEQLIKSNNPSMYDYMRHYIRNDVEEGVAAVKSGELDAFIYDASVLSFKAGRDKNCQLRTVGKWYAPTGYGFALPKSSKWLNLINKHILDYQMSGYLQHLEDYWLSSSCKEHFSKQLGHRSAELGFVNFQSAFGLLAFAVCCCAVSLGLEHLYVKVCRPRMRHIDKFDACRFISPSLGKALTFKSAVQSVFKKSNTEIACSHPNCQFRQKYLMFLLARSKDKIRRLESSNREARERAEEAITMYESHQYLTVEKEELKGSHSSPANYALYQRQRRLSAPSIAKPIEERLNLAVPSHDKPTVAQITESEI